MSFDADLLILGGGCAGLSLGVHLALDEMSRRRTLILEQRRSYTNDRTWCFWRSEAHPFEHLISHSWQTMRVQSRPAQVVVNCGATPYQMLSSGAFYQYAEAAIASASAVELQLGATVRKEPVQIAGGWLVETAQGSVRARQIVDTRPPVRTRTSDALLWQSFTGDEIECASAVFDPSLAELMDFQAVSDNGIAFIYVLPMSPTRALVEYTVFGRRPLSPAALADAQAAAVDRVARGHPVRVLRQECGALPMGLAVSGERPLRDYCHVGLMYGAGRASTGYAFQRIQRWAKSAAASLRRDGFAIGHAPDSWHQRSMDRLFLQVLREHPERAADLFLTMFRDADASRVIRFLSDRGTAIDCAAIIATLPVGLFLSQLLRSGITPSPVMRGST